MSSLTGNMVEFISVLRLSGVRVSISETIDAVNVLEYINLLSRNEVKAALSACLAKSEEERKLFSEAFDRYFIGREQRAGHFMERTKELEQKRMEVMEAVSELTFKGEQLELENELKEVYAGIPEEEKQGIREFLDRTSNGKNVKPSFKPVVEKMLKGRLNNLKPTYLPETGRARTDLWAVPSEAGIIAGETIDEVKEKDGLLHKKLSGLSDEDALDAVRLIRRIAEGLKKNVSRRYKKTGRKSGIDLKRTIRANLSTGYVQFRIRYKRRPARKDKFLVLCDVSSSMYRFSGFVLQFLIGMHTNASSMDSFIFSEEAEHLNMSDFKNALDFEHRIKTSPVWRKGTNIGNVLSHIFDRKDIVLNSSTIVVVVSDAKTLDSAAAAEKLKRMAAKVKRILWLNPVPESDWAGTSGIGEFRKYSSMYDCSTLEKLAAACRSFSW